MLETKAFMISSFKTRETQAFASSAYKYQQA